MGITSKIKYTTALAVCVAATAAEAAPAVLGTPVTQGVLGDANRDGITDFLDFQVLERNFNRPGSPAQGDFDGSGFVDLSDFSLFQSSVGKRQVPAFFGKIADYTTRIPAGAA